jgi:hypothetical protein
VAALPRPPTEQSGEHRRTHTIGRPRVPDRCRSHKVRTSHDVTPTTFRAGVEGRHRRAATGVTELGVGLSIR